MISNIVCSSFKRPKVAICIAGASRTFHTELVYKTIKHNLLDSFGGEQTVFAYLKLADARGDNNSKYNGLIESDKEKVLKAINYIGIEKDNYILVKNPNIQLPRRLNPHKIKRLSYEYSLAGQLTNRKEVSDIVLNYEKK